MRDEFDNFLTFCLQSGKIVNNLMISRRVSPVTLLLSVIDQSPVHQHHTLLTAPGLSLELAIECERLGYHRYWLAEHHNSIQFSGTAPEILITRIASATRSMRVGSGGVMLSHYSPYKVAETFALLGGLFPGRIDLGIGRAPGGSALSSHALAVPSFVPDVDQFPTQAAMLCAFLRDGLPPVTLMTSSPSICRPSRCPRFGCWVLAVAVPNWPVNWGWAWPWRSSSPQAPACRGFLTITEGHGSVLHGSALPPSSSGRGYLREYG